MPEGDFWKYLNVKLRWRWFFFGLECDVSMPLYPMNQFFFPSTKMHFLPQSIFYTLFLNEDGRTLKMVLVSCIIDFDDIQL